MTYSTAKSHRIYACDGLRAIALLGVIAFHVWPSQVPGGYFGVNIFFILAGFFVSRKIYYGVMRDGVFNLPAFYSKRLRRLYLPLIPLLITVSLWTYFAQPGVYTNVRQNIPSVMLFYNNISQLLGNHSYFATHGNFQPFTHMWALSLEVQFYLLYPLLLLLVRRVYGEQWRKTGRALLGLSVLSAILMAVRYHAGADPTPIYYSLFCRLFAFTLGGGAAIYYLATPLSCYLRCIPTRIRNLLTALCLVIIISAFFFMGYQNHVVYRGGMFLYSVITTVCVLLIYPQDSNMASLLSTRCLRILSNRSYSYYIWQYVLLVLGNSWFAFSTTPITTRRLLHFLLLLVIGEVSYRLFEQKTVIWQNFNCRRLLITASVMLLVLMQFNLRPTIADIPPQPVPQPAEQNQIDESRINVDEELQQLRVTAIGDSVLDMAREQLELHLPKCTVDAKISRQIQQGVKILEEFEDEGTTGDVILISLGTNGDFKERVLDQYYRLAGEKPLVFLTTVMPDSWEQSVNNKFHQYAATHPGVYVVDWYALAKSHPEWFYSDGTHPKPEGVRQLVELILVQLEHLILVKNA